MNIDIPTYKIPLDNNLTVLFKENTTQNLLAYNFYIKVGSKQEPDTLLGISNLTNHLIIQNIDNTFIKHNIKINTSYDGSSFYGILQHNYLDTLLDFFFQSFFKLNLESDTLKRQKSIVKAQIIKESEDFESLGLNTLKKVLFKKHPYSRNILGTLESIDNISVSDIQKYYNSYYINNNIILTFVGNLSIFNLLDKLKKYDNKNTYKDIDFNEINENLTSFEEVQLLKDTFKSHLFLGFRIPGLNSKLKYTIDVLIDIMNRENSYLYKELVLTKLCPFIKVNKFNLAEQDILYIYTSPNELSKLDEIKSKIINTLYNIKEKELNAKDLRLSIENLKYKFIKNQTNLIDSTFKIIENEVNGGIKQELNYLYNIENINLDDLRYILNEFIIYPNMSIVEILPKNYKSNTISYDFSILGTKPENYKLNLTPDIIKNKNNNLSNKKVTKFNLTSGLNCILVEENISNFINLGLYSKFGAVDDYPPKMGLINLLMNTIKFTLLDKSYQNITEDLKFELHLDINQDYSGLIFSVQQDKVIKLFELLKQIIYNFTFSKNYLDIAKAEVTYNLYKIEEDIDLFGAQNLKKAIFSQHKYSRPVYGEESNIKQINIDDIIESYKNYFTLNNLYLLGLGNFQIKNLNVLLEKYFNQGETLNINQITNEDIYNSISSRRGEIFLSKDTDIVHIFTGILLPGLLNDDYIPLIILSSAINYIFKYKLITKKELASEFISTYETNKYAGILILKLISNTKNIVNLKKEIKQIIQNITENLNLSDQEFYDIKQQIINDFISEQSNNICKLKTIAKLELCGLGYNFYEQYIKYIKEVSLKEVERVAKKYIDIDNLTTVIVMK